MICYTLSYDFTTTAGIHEQLAAFVKANRHVAQWTHPFAGLYLLKSYADLQTLSNSFGEFFAKRTLHMITPIEADKAQGYMPGYLWAWLHQSELTGLNGLLSQYLPKLSDP